MNRAQKIKKLTQFFATVNGAKVLTILARTSIKNPFPKEHKYNGIKIFKVIKRNCMVNCNYEDNVNAQRKREGKEANFVAQESYGKKIEGFPYILTDDNFLLRVRVLKDLETTYTDEYGNVIDSHIIEKFIQKKEKNSNQGVDKEVIVRNYGIDNLLSVIADGETIQLE